jgi:hypothetical protein
MEAKDWVLLVGVGVTLVLGLANLLHTLRAYREGQIKDRKAVIDSALAEFYHPLLGYLNISHGLFKIFAAGKPADFRTLTYLIDSDQAYSTPTGMVRVDLTESDRQVLREILRVGRRIEDLIVTKSGHVDDRSLLFEYIPDPKFTDIDLEVVKGQGLLAIAVTHLRLIRLAFRGHLEGQADRYKSFVYPRELNKRVFEKIESLRAEREWLATLNPASLDPEWSIAYRPSRAADRGT